ncbi:fungal-specific transcription factor domain-containing protein [Aspergillus ambiguus]|uniref:transcription factor domain-containing protein n=1 Tax=Aspergillus ambiguus TaxID=176160 RepID=UPI003CCE348B
MASGDDEGAPSAPPKKVRLACRRCRAKRVKCDGGIPACGNCARAGASCVDVDGRNNDRSIPRDYMSRYTARIQWLEQQVQRLDPSFDLSQGPQVDGIMPRTSTSNGSLSVTASNASQLALAGTIIDTTEDANPPKRTYTEFRASDTSDSPVTVEARSVAMDLGMLSLHSDSRQKHYLGSSSGLFFTRLIGADHDVSPSASPQSSSASARGSQRRRVSQVHNPQDKYRLLYDKLLKELPSQEEADELFDVYFREIHFEHPFMHPTSLRNAYNALHACTEQDNRGNIDADGWIEGIDAFSYNGRCEKVADRRIVPISISTAVLHVFMVFSLAATILTRKKNFDHSPSRFYRLAVSAAAESLSSISVPALQGVLLFVLQGMVGPSNLNIWTLTHVAMSHCIDLGLHREPRDLHDISTTALAMRRFIFYTVYNLDRTIATIQGRPLGIRDETFDLRIPDLDELPEEHTSMTNNFNDTSVYTRWPDDSKLSIYCFELDKSISEIKLLLYHLPTKGGLFSWPSDYSAIQTRVKASLDEWFTQVSALRLTQEADQDDDQFVHYNCKLLKLEALYHGAIILLYQPSQVFPSPTQSALLICHQSASRRLQIYNQLNNEENMYYTWRDIHGIFSAGATIIYCFWACREIQSMIPLADALRDLRICSNLLSVGGQWWPSVRTGRDNFDKIVDLTIKQLSQLQTRNAPGKASRQEPPTRRFDVSERFSSPAQQAVFNTPSGHDTGILSAAHSDRALENIIFGEPEPFGQPFEMPQLSANSPSESLAIDSAMESFLAEYVHGDWSWDPFSISPNMPLP